MMSVAYDERMGHSPQKKFGTRLFISGGPLPTDDDPLHAAQITSTTRQ